MTEKDDEAYVNAVEAWVMLKVIEQEEESSWPIWQEWLLRGWLTVLAIGGIMAVARAIYGFLCL